MTNEEAIKIIEFVLGRGELAERYGLNNSGISVYPHLSEEREALNMAIEALKNKRDFEKEYMKHYEQGRKDRLYTAHEVAEILMDVLGEECPCNLKCTDEWLSEKCELSQDVCPDCGIEGWMQFLKYRGNEE